MGIPLATETEFWAAMYCAASIRRWGSSPWAVGPSSSSAADDMFFKGKTIRIVVAFSVGGGFDLYSRTIGRHMGRYIPGKSAVPGTEHDRRGRTHLRQLRVQERPSPTA